MTELLLKHNKQVFYITYSYLHEPTTNQHCQIECFSKEQAIVIFNKNFTNCHILKVETGIDIAQNIASNLVSQIMFDIKKMIK